jgi:cytidine deaminase
MKGSNSQKALPLLRFRKMLSAMNGPRTLGYLVFEHHGIISALGVSTKERSMPMADTDKLLEQARRAAEASYCPYSRFRVGAALLCADGTVFTGTNVENRSYGLTNCAERSAVFSAVSAGRKKFEAIAISTPDSKAAVAPCGACRQVLSEFAGEDFPVTFAGQQQRVDTTLGDLYPYDSLQDLRKED